MIETIASLGEGRAPPEVLAALREIDSQAELVHLGDTTWWLGVKAPNPTAVEELEHAHEKMRGVPELEDPAERAIVKDRLEKEFLMRQIMAQGFRPIALYHVDGAPGWDIVDDFRVRDFNWRTKTEAQVRRELFEYADADLGNQRRIKRFGEAARELAAEAFRFVFKHARSFTRRAIIWR